MKRTLISTLLILLALLIWVGVDVYRNEQIDRIRARPEEPIDSRINQVLLDVRLEKTVNYDDLQGTFEYVRGRYDCSDFRLQSMIRLLYEYHDSLPEESLLQIKNTLLSFKYWMDQPGEDAMCFWSENHQLLFAASEYLAGQFWPDEIFTNDGKTGAEHLEIGKERMLIWLEQRWLYGFTEWYSNVYYTEDIAPLSNLIDFAEDQEIVAKSTIIMDLLLHDLASQSHKAVFVSSSGRMYENQKRNPGKNSMQAVTNKIWGDTWDYGKKENPGMVQNFLYIKNYTLPEVIRQVGLDTRPLIIKATNGLDISELKGEGLNGTGTAQIMMQWAMEAFTNPEIVKNSVKYINRNNMLGNEFLHDFKLINIGFLKTFGLLPTVSRILNPVTNGTAIQRANVYNYRTNDFMLATAQAYHPGDYGDQHHIWNATISDKLSIFTTHPAKPLSDNGALSGSPGYWVGNGRNPHSVQHENIVMNIYRIPDKKGFMESSLVHFTHANFPSGIMDTVLLDGSYAFGKYGSVLVSFTARYPLEYNENTTDDLIQEGADSYWIFEISTLEEENSLEDFITRIKSNEVSYENDVLQYQSGDKTLELKYQGSFSMDGQEQDTQYRRFDSPWSRTERKPETMRIEQKGYSLELDFYNMKRIFN